jgi:ATP-dependent Lon protease
VPGPVRRKAADDDVGRRIAALYDVLTGALGADKVVLRAGKLGALPLMRSQAAAERLLGLQRLVFEDPTRDKAPPRAGYDAALDEIADGLADLLAQRSVDETIERKVNERMAERHVDYLRDLRIETLRDEAGPETPATEARLRDLEALESRSLPRPAVQAMRPAALAEIVGNENAVRALVAKLASPLPQHVILYGPPGVGKTTAARLALGSFAPEAPFVECSGTTLRYDPREATNPLLGSVHDPIYQGSRKELGESGIPEPKLGLVSRAHGGVLFIDELGEMDAALQLKLLKVLEDKRVTFESSYYDERDPNVPAYVHKIFRDGAPADFTLVGATTRDPSELDPALRSRCAEIFFEPLTETQIAAIVRGTAERIGVRCEAGVDTTIASYTMEGRKAVQVLVDAFGFSHARRKRPVQNGGAYVSRADVAAAAQVARLVTHDTVRARPEREVGRAYGLGVLHYVGSVIEIEAVAFPARTPGKGTFRFNETAGSMARDSAFNAAAVVRAVSGLDCADFDIHVNVVGGGNIDGPSAGLAIFAAIWSAVTDTPLPQDVALTGEVSIQGKVRRVGGIVEKAYAARQSGMRRFVLPRENADDCDTSVAGVSYVLASDVRDAFRALDLAVEKPRRRRSA